ncbi:MAG: hypothetical protein Q8K64_03925 [Sediminibacterium sp.]|nr:hypothetical protein [Sediminibacterium sp.]
MMKKKFYFLHLMIATAFTVKAQEQKKEGVCHNPNLVKDTSKKSIKSMAFAVINCDSIKINYHSPGVCKRLT